MIRTNLAEISTNEQAKDLAVKINDFIKNNDVVNLQCGQYQLGEGEFVNVVSGKAMEYDGVMESHKDYIDVHFVVSGRERLYYEDVIKLNPITEYNKKDDYILYKNFNVSEFDVDSGNMVVLFPNDGHRMIVKSGDEDSKKLIFKLNVR